jgi:thioredoxin 1
MELEEIRKKKMEEMKAKINSPNKPIEINDGNFEEIKKKYSLFIIDCWAEWCMPCKIIEPMIERLAKEHNGKIVFGRLNVDKNRLTPTKYRIMSIPTLLVFKNGELIDKIIGAMPYDVLNSKIKLYLK